MTLQVTIAHASPGLTQPKDALVKQTGAPDMRIKAGESKTFTLTGDNEITSITEVDAELAEASPQGGGGPGQVDPPV